MNIKTANRLTELRKSKGLSQEELAAAVGYRSANSRSTINKVETGKNDVLQTKLPLYAEALGVSVVELLALDEPEQSPTPQTPDDLLAFALFGDSSVVTAEDLEDIRKFAAFIKDRRKNETQKVYGRNTERRYAPQPCSLHRHRNNIK